MRNSWRIAGLCGLVGIFISSLPHLIFKFKYGSFAYFADYDDLDVYLTLASQAYHHNPWHLSDPVFSGGGGSGSMYSWIELGPCIVIARALGLGPVAIGLLWRVFAGLSIGVLWYFIFELLLRRKWLSFFCTVIMLSDVGVVSVWPIGRQFVLAIQFLLGKITSENLPVLHSEWRIVTPGLSLWFLLLFVYLLLRALEAPSGKGWVWAGLGLGLLFYAYFYFWTAAMLGLALAFSLDGKNRSMFFQVAVLGLGIGIPALLQGYFTKQQSSEWLIRSDYFVPIRHFSELLFPKGALAALVITGILVCKKHPRHLWLWLLALSGILLTNHQIVTGLQIQNHHWHYVYGPVLSFLLLFTCVRWLESRLPRRRVLPLLFAFSVLHYGAGIYLRAQETLLEPETGRIIRDYHDFLSLRKSNPQVKIGKDRVIAGIDEYVGISTVVDDMRPLSHYAVLISPGVSDAEWDERRALNGFLMGQSLSEFERAQNKEWRSFYWGKWARDPALREQRFLNLLGTFRRISQNPGFSIAKYNVRYVALPSNEPTPAYLASSGSQLFEGARWKLWQLRERE